jgi:ABC-type branched-subunit amino acid transport system substrate-binding protein
VLARAEDVKDDATVWIGAMFAKDGPMAEQFDGAIRDVELARRDFLEVASGLPSTHAGSLPRPIGVIMCNDAHDPLRAARHLADDVRVPAIVGFSRSKEVLDLAAAVFNPRHVVAFASNTASMLSEITPPPGEPRMVWRTTLSATTRASVMTALVSEVIEPELRAHVLKKGEPVRVAFLGFGNPTGMSISDAFAASLRFNGKGVADNGKDFLSLSRDDERPMADDLTRFVRELVAFGPNIVLDMATDGELVPALEGAWKGPNRPRYVSGGYGDDFWGDSVTDPTLGRRVLDVEPGLNDTANTKFDLRYDAVYDPTTSPTHSKTGGPYDAFYALAYAMVALGDAPITGSAIARSLSRIGGPGERVDVGPGGIFAATSALARGEKIDLEGTMTSLDFDPATGDPTVSFTVLCAKRLKGGGARIPSGLTWDGSTKKLVGTLRCQ